MQKIGIMGGSFDPPHIGHLILAECVREKLDLAEVRFMPVGKIAYKDAASASTQERLEMTRLAVAGNAHFKVDGMETERDGNTYTYETMELLTKAEPDKAFVFIVGADSLDYMERWRHPERLFRCCSVAAVLRPGFSHQQMEQKRRELAEKFSAHIEFVTVPQIQISSTELRQKIARGGSVRYQVPEAVLAYMEQHGIYRLG